MDEQGEPVTSGEWLMENAPMTDPTTPDTALRDPMCVTCGHHPSRHIVGLTWGHCKEPGCDCDRWAHPDHRPTALRDEEMSAEEALREALGYALMLAKVHGSPVHEHLGDLLRAVVPDTIRALPDGWSLVGPDATRMAAALGEGDRQSLMERVSLLPRFATNTGDYVDVEAVLDILREDPR